MYFANWGIICDKQNPASIVVSYHTVCRDYFHLLPILVWSQSGPAFDIAEVHISPKTSMSYPATSAVRAELEAGKTPLPVIVVDHVNEKPGENPPEAAKAFPPVPTEFEVADLKPSDPDTRGDDFQLQPGGRLKIHG